MISTAKPSSSKISWKSSRISWVSLTTRTRFPLPGLTRLERPFGFTRARIGPLGLFAGRERVPLPFRCMRIYTRKGDAGTTGLLYGGPRVSKAELRTDAYGSTDEAVSDLGVARASFGALTDRVEARLHHLVVRLQRELFVVGAELATDLDRRSRLKEGTTLVTAEMITALEHEIDALEADHPMPKEFVIPGESSSGAALDVARSTVRRAEWRLVALAEAGWLPSDSPVMPFEEPLADLLSVMARAADGGFLPLHGDE